MALRARMYNDNTIVVTTHTEGGGERVRVSVEIEVSRATKSTRARVRGPQEGKVSKNKRRLTADVKRKRR